MSKTTFLPLKVNDILSVYFCFDFQGKCQDILGRSFSRSGFEGEWEGPCAPQGLRSFPFPLADDTIEPLSVTLINVLI